MNIPPFLAIFWKAATRFFEDDATTLAGALAFTTLFAIPPVLLIIITLLGYISGGYAVTADMYEQITKLWGSRAAQTIRMAVDNYQLLQQGFITSLLGIGIFLVASSSFFAVIQHSLNRIWRVKPIPESNLFHLVKIRALSFLLIILLVFLQLVSVMLESVLIILREKISIIIPQINTPLFAATGLVTSFLLITLILATIYKLLPDVKIRWRIVWAGAAFTSLLFSLGKLVIGFVLSQSNLYSLYGVAGSILVVLLWVYYSALILFYGAEVTQQFGHYRGYPIEPKPYAVAVED
ncbi:YihY/virulence factor BrkB family protein [Aliifodinibius sp. S!AR15-10]|uniref:YihY/virulence factor BrkB family protein n=1 Tax=Aliifodinibius sp. S!AR15-10 TaxID=2950437 RepID=UPI002865DEDF|nr:YihY/virulence factor BrkB family protein [Aliifodinibius sp. S!AR15-10]MDR8393671.1 YihY/virulence factor BrkB family protein [Aliifodinibius sp. S!AR15-10]